MNIGQYSNGKLLRHASSLVATNGFAITQYNLPMTSAPYLLFVYNADSGVVNALKDLWHKTVSPETYDCQLCAVTYGPLGMRPQWRRFVKGLELDVKFLHRDELRDQYGLSDVDLPAVFKVEASGQVNEWIEAKQVRGVQDLEAMMELLRKRLGEN